MGTRKFRFLKEGGLIILMIRKFRFMRVYLRTTEFPPERKFEAHG